MTKDGAGVEFPAGQRLGAGIFGIFLVCFGMPFTLVPFFMLPEILAMGELLISLFLICFTIPFLLAGLLVQYTGVSSIRLALNPNNEKAKKIFSQLNSGANDSVSTSNALEYYKGETPAERRAKKNLEQPKQTGNFWDNIDTDPP